MSKHKSNVNPDHYKTAGREPIGRDVIQEVQRQQYAQSKAEEKKEVRPKSARSSKKVELAVESTKGEDGERNDSVKG